MRNVRELAQVLTVGAGRHRPIAVNDSGAVW
jgi:hypothetical protein